jgi:integrase
MVDDVVRVLDGLSQREHFTGPPDRVFPSPVGGPIDDRGLREGLYTAMGAAGVSRERETGKPFVWHDLRHSFGTMAVQAFPLSDVQGYLGYAGVATTMRYVHHVPQHDAADRLSALVVRATEGPPSDREAGRAGATS